MEKTQTVAVQDFNIQIKYGFSKNYHSKNYLPSLALSLLILKLTFSKYYKNIML